MDKIQPELLGIPQTMLWPLYNRAVGSRTRPQVFKDPFSEAIFDRIDFDFAGHFGPPEVTFALRARMFDQAVSSFLHRHPDGVVVNLGEGLDTQRYRVPENRAHWYSVDVEEAIAIRERFIACDDRHHHLAESATSERWLRCLPTGRPVFIGAAGLLMYLPESDVRTLLQRCAQQFPMLEVLFDHVPHWLSRRSMRGWKLSPRYQVPAMPWGLNGDQLRPQLQHWLPTLRTLTVLPYRLRERSPDALAFGVINAVPWLRHRMPALAHLQF